LLATFRSCACPEGHATFSGQPPVFTEWHATLFGLSPIFTEGHVTLFSQLFASFRRRNAALPFAAHYRIDAMPHSSL